ncbi:MAG: porin family protein [Burkholderiales bacterium]|nr:MAG: porin family protein [Burkholderiales bacterium]
MTNRVSTALAALSALAVLAAIPALAQETRAEPSWTGAYVGAGLGAGYLSTDQYSPPQAGYGGYAAATYAGWHPYGSIQAGLDLQLGTTVLGVRLQHAVTNSAADSFWKVDELVSANAVALTTLSARAGHLFQPQLLGYASASVVAGHFNYGSVDERWSQVDDSLDATRFGLGIGAGIEYRLTDTISVITEYTHLQFITGSSTFDYGTSGFLKNWTYDYTHRLGMVQAGVNFRF